MKKRLKNKLNLKKETLSSLTGNEMVNLRGGGTTTFGSGNVSCNCGTYETLKECPTIITCQ